MDAHYGGMVNHIGPRQYFGENGLVSHVARNSTVKQLSATGFMLMVGGADFRSEFTAEHKPQPMYRSP